MILQILTDKFQSKIYLIYCGKLNENLCRDS